jgi:hypothetical protein
MTQDKSTRCPTLARTEEKTMTEHRDGRSVAAWTAVGILLVAAFLVSLAVVVKSWPMAITGLALVVVGMAAGKVLAMAGFGQDRSEHTPRH